MLIRNHRAARSRNRRDNRNVEVYVVYASGREFRVIACCAVLIYSSSSMVVWLQRSMELELKTTYVSLSLVCPLAL